MANKIFQQLLDERIESFRHSYTNVSRQLFFNAETNRLSHAGEFGIYREAVCREFLRFFIPRRLAIDTGFIISPDDKVSSQCDLIVYDADATPLIESGTHQRFFPVETVCAVGEIKSVLTKKQLSEAAFKLSEVKSLRESVPSPVPIFRRNDFNTSYDPLTYLYDHLFTFIICEKVEGIAKEDNTSFVNYPASTPCQRRHNMILSLTDGLLLYNAKSLKKSFPYPFTIDLSKNVTELKERLVTPDADEKLHIKLFVNYLFLATSCNTILHPDLIQYMSLLSGGINIDKV